jgi:hypothetical protein
VVEYPASARRVETRLSGGLGPASDLIADPAKNFKVIMKDGRVYKNTL